MDVKLKASSVKYLQDVVLIDKPRLTITRQPRDAPPALRGLAVDADIDRIYMPNKQPILRQESAAYSGRK